MPETFQSVIQSTNFTLVDFHATWCGPCKMMKPILEDLKNSMGTSLRILKLDVDKNPAASQAYQVQGVPTLILFKKGKLLWRESGVLQAKELEKIIQGFT